MESGYDKSIEILEHIVAVSKTSSFKNGDRIRLGKHTICIRHDHIACDISYSGTNAPPTLTDFNPYFNYDRNLGNGFIYNLFNQSRLECIQELISIASELHPSIVRGVQARLRIASNTDITSENFSSGGFPSNFLSGVFNSGDIRRTILQTYCVRNFEKLLKDFKKGESLEFNYKKLKVCII